MKRKALSVWQIEYIGCVGHVPAHSQVIILILFKGLNSLFVLRIMKINSSAQTQKQN